MAESAERQVRGILAATRTRVQIDALMDQLRAEFHAEAEPIPYQLADPADLAGRPEFFEQVHTLENRS
ncbi:hypothetical protein ACEZCY_14540 [Streptacidiphilus sp. N1-12]|uniref:Uncharacterized protein n=2 Tax=Streptacidiphilus alkalitolerans TaxID=3342712 RepID=A0ABV6V9S3_9ACTN